MRWQVAVPKEVRPGDRRLRKGFLFLPKRIGLAVRWLEWAEWVQEAYEHKFDLSFGSAYPPPEEITIRWRDVTFAS